MAQDKKVQTQDFLPLIVIIGSVAVATMIKSYTMGSYWMHDFMGFFLLIFGSLKAYNLHGFAQAFTSYDIPAFYIPGYAYLYPFIELTLGLCYLFTYALWYTHITTIAIMLAGALGVLQALISSRSISCACLGMVFVLPMTYVTLAEDLLMAGMAGYMLMTM